ncbi:hypothetical protein LCGC14_1097780 [marine sediment metagenome]|uniref:Uncharacterized protein n=1 Tax=marine sediment metagenome TaxID=412755 RepID=A0A0F9MAI3_9ZZZZ
MDLLLIENLTWEPRHTVILFCSYYWVPHTKFSKKPKTGFYSVFTYGNPYERNQ